MKLPDQALLPLALLFVLLSAFAVFSPCLSCFYFSEDIIQTWIAFQALSAHPQLLIEHLTMPWFQCSNMGLFCRPLVEFSFIADRLLFGNNPGGAHLSNLLCHLTSTALSFFISRRILNAQLATELNVGGRYATLTAALAALLFGIYPLQIETLYWLCCRCDCLSTMLALATIYLGLRGTPWCTALSALTYFLAVESKENAVMAPLALFVYGCFYATKKPVWKSALLSIWPYLPVLAICALLRYQVLGGLGGYHGTFGAVFEDQPWLRILDPTAWNKIVYPLDEEKFFNLPWYALLFSLSYLIMAVGAVTGIRKETFDRTKIRLVCFGVCAALALMPASLRVFLIMGSLVGGHFLYLSQAFTALTMAVFLTSLRPLTLRNIFIPAYIILLACTTVINSSAWVERSNNLRAFQQGANRWAQLNQAHPERKLCLLNMPMDAREFSSVYDLEQLRNLLRPPINSLDISNRIVEPSYIRMAADVVCKSRIKTLLDTGTVDFVLSSAALQNPFKLLDSAELQKHFAPVDESIPFNQTKTEAGRSYYQLDLSGVKCPQRADLVQIVCAPPNRTKRGRAVVRRGQPLMFCPRGDTVTLNWQTDLSLIDPAISWCTAPFAAGDCGELTLLFPLADRLSWKYAGQVNKLFLTNMPPGFAVSSVRLLDESAYTPTLGAATRTTATVDPANCDTISDGYFGVNNLQTTEVSWDAGRIKGAVSTVLQISSRDFVYSNYADGYRESTTVLEKGHTSKTLKDRPLSGSLTLNRESFAAPGKYQVRVAACDANGQILGFCSDPIDCIVSDRPFGGAYEKSIFNLRALKETGKNQ
ncbi:MAG: hypothetical protein JSS83_06030 [Cyanobacteria bacterium SZAS LIN-3]|nr:hypothetical protein [Cyanobacteria bacterium SZAS LIN-3]